MRGRPPLEHWQVEHGTPGGERWHYRRGEKPCQVCRNARNERRREYTRLHHPNASAFHADHGGRPRCGQLRPHAIAGPGQEVTCGRCLLLAAEARAA